MNCVICNQLTYQRYTRYVRFNIISIPLCPDCRSIVHTEINRRIQRCNKILNSEFQQWIEQMNLDHCQSKRQQLLDV